MVGLKQREIDSLGKWYQTIDFGKFGKSKGSATDMEKKWSLVKKYLPFDLKRKRVLDLGCNAGYFMFKSALEGAMVVQGVEENTVFYEQCLFALDLLGKIDSRVKDTVLFVCNNDFKSFLLQNIYDITFAFNFFYWLTYSDEGGSIEKPQDAFLRCLNKLAYHTEYMLVIGAEGVGKMREKNNANDLGTSLQRTLPFLEVYFDILKKDIIRQSRKRLSNIILCRSKKRS